MNMNGRIDGWMNELQKMNEQTIIKPSHRDNAKNTHAMKENWNDKRKRSK